MYGLVNSGLLVVKKGVFDFLLKKKILYLLYLWYGVVWILGLLLRGKIYEFRKDYYKNDSWKSRRKG
jgi:hypothetical protein